MGGQGREPGTVRRSRGITRGQGMRRSRNALPYVPTPDYTEARAKVDREGRCRVCGAQEGYGVHLEAAHVLGRKHDPKDATGRRIVVPEAVVALCRRSQVADLPKDLEESRRHGGCHPAYDAHALNLRPYLTDEEWHYAVGLVGLGDAERRTMGRAWRTTEEPPT